MNSGIQRIAAALGEAGCYLMAIVKHAELLSSVRFDIIRVYEDTLAAGEIKADCFVLEPAKILSKLTGRSWALSKQDASYAPKPGELQILRYEWSPKPMSVLGHFVAADSSGKIVFDSMGEDSPVVKNGKLVSKRIFTPL